MRLRDIENNKRKIIHVRFNTHNCRSRRYLSTIFQQIEDIAVLNQKVLAAFHHVKATESDLLELVMDMMILEGSI